MTANNPYYHRHILSKICKDADQTELVALRLTEARASSGIRDDVISETIEDDFPSPLGVTEEGWQTRETSVDSATSQLLEEIERRKDCLRELYPFSLDGDVVKYQQSDDLLYEFFLCTSLSPNLIKGEYRHFPRIFERIAVELTANFLGPNTKFAHVGAPNEKKRFKNSFINVMDESGELKWRPGDDLPDDGPRNGDEGVDYILWKSFDCNRSVGQPFFLGQCACGNDWDAKFNDISARFFKWFEPLKVPPTKVFSVPHVVPEIKLREAARDAGVVLDRIRLVRSIQAGSHYCHDKWHEKLFKAICLIADV